MARVHEEDVIIRISKIVRDDDNSGEPIVSEEICTTIEQVVGELIPDHIIEVTTAETE